MKIRQNYENYQRVKDAFKEFIHALVWESANIECGTPEDEIDEHIEKYCKNNADQMIALTNDSVAKFIKSFIFRFEVHCYEVDKNGNVIEETAKHLETDNTIIAFKKAAEFYRNAKCPKVNIYDNELDRYVAKWD